MREVTILAPAAVVVVLIIEDSNSNTLSTILYRIAHCSNGAFWCDYMLDTTSYKPNVICAHHGPWLDYLEPPGGLEGVLWGGRTQ